MTPIRSDILFLLFKQANERIWYYDTKTDKICYVGDDRQTEEAIPFDEHMAMKHPDDRQQVYDSMEYMTRTHKPTPEPMMIRYRDNSQPDGYRYTLNAIMPVFEGGAMYVVGSEQDVTALVRKQQLAEKQTLLIEELLRRRREDTWTINTKTGIMHMKRQDGKEYDLTIEQLIDTVDMDESRDAINAFSSFQRGEAKMFEFYIKEKEPRNDGKRHYFKCTSMPSKFDLMGRVTEYVGIGSDVTREVADNRRLKQALADAKEQSHQKSLFVARASHDIRNPLNVLLNISEMMCMDIPLEERQELFDLIKQSGETLLTLVNDILDLTSIESNLKFDKEEVNVVELIDDLVQSFDISTNKSHNITVQSDVTVPVVMSNSKRLTQIVSNYISNAVKYSDPGSEIKVTLRSNDKEFYIAVTDHGCGISNTDKGRVFNEFARFNTEVKGTGLGLSICKRIAEALDGSVGFESTEGQGSTFWVKFRQLSKCHLEDDKVPLREPQSAT